jgi:hypothetical protein
VAVGAVAARNIVAVGPVAVGNNIVAVGAAAARNIVADNTAAARNVVADNPDLSLWDLARFWPEQRTNSIEQERTQNPMQGLAKLQNC